MEIVIRHLAERGIASVAYMAGKEISFESAELFAMFHTQMRAHHLATETEWNKFGDRSVQRGFDCAMRLFPSRSCSRRQWCVPTMRSHSV